MEYSGFDELTPPSETLSFLVQYSSSKHFMGRVTRERKLEGSKTTRFEPNFTCKYFLLCLDVVGPVGMPQGPSMETWPLFSIHQNQKLVRK